jgi:ribonuclease-3
VSRADHPLAVRLGVPEVGGPLLQRALTHRSWSSEHRDEPHNERLELLGDAVLDLVVTAELHALDVDADEGVLSRRRAQLVRESTLADVAREVGLGDDLRLGRGEAASGGAGKDSLLANALEAVIGAVFVTSGYERAAELVVRLLGARLQSSGAVADGTDRGAGPVDAKTALQEQLAALQRPAPHYRMTKAGPDHAPVFVAEVLVDGEVIGSGSGGSKKVAAQAAAEQALRREPLG